ncbi:hypothetical protein AB0D42_36660 [Streptomyces sp. NPDC048304]|uniref:hypothetical protein n=1 Tax=Streptomyces sp. NPDC048304 TaxID=3154820 RepID=UPI0033C8910D
MTSVLRHSYVRALGAGALSVALLSGGTAGAFAASPSPSPTPSMSMDSPMPGMSMDSTMPGMSMDSPTPGMSMASPSMGDTMARPTPGGTMASPTTGMASITVRAHKSSVKAGQTVNFTGRTKGLKIGTPLVLQHMKSGKWTPLKATAKVRRGSSYSIVAKLNTKGTETLRVAAANGSAKVYSSTVTVKVS